MSQHHWVIEDIKEVRKTGGRSNIPQSSSEAAVKIYQVLKCRCSCCCWALAHMNLWDQPKPTLYLSTPTPFFNTESPTSGLRGGAEGEVFTECWGSSWKSLLWSSNTGSIEMRPRWQRTAQFTMRPNTKVAFIPADTHIFRPRWHLVPLWLEVLNGASYKTPPPWLWGYREHAIFH